MLEGHLNKEGKQDKGGQHPADNRRPAGRGDEAIRQQAEPR